MARIRTREFEDRLTETLRMMRQEAQPFDASDLKTQEKRKRRAAKDLIFFVKTYLPHYFYDGFAPCHKEMAVAAGTRERPVLIVSGGGFGKTSLVTIGAALQSLLFKVDHFIVVGGKTEDLAEQNTAMIRLELDENERIKQDFGPQKGNYWWEDGDFVTAGDVRVKARGVGQAFRGLRWRQYRPSLFLGDDIEDDELAVSQRRVSKVLTWLHATVLPRMEPTRWRLLVCGNIINRTGVIGTILYHPDYAEWLRKVFPAEDAKGLSTWPERFSQETLARLKRVLGFVRYAREMKCEPIDDSHYFQPENTHDFSFSRLCELEDLVAFIDPSVIASRKGDYKAIVVTGKRKEDPRTYVGGCWIRHATVDAMIGQCYYLWETLKPKIFALEGNGYQEHLKRDFDRWALKKGFQLPLAKTNTTENKSVRIERLEAPHDSGDLLFCKEIGDTPVLLEQLYQWEPNGPAHDDGPDALAGAMEYRMGKRQKARFRSL